MRMALFLGLPFLCYALGPDAWLFRLVARLPGFRSVELPMHGWFLPALGLALLGGAGLSRLPRRMQPLIVAALCVDVFVFNQLLHPLAFARQGFEELYAVPLRAFHAQLRAANPPVERLYAPPLTAIGYRNHPLQSRIETTYGYNPLELSSYQAYVDTAETNPRLVDGLAVTHRLVNGSTIQPNPSALPLAFVARRISLVADDAAARVALTHLDPALETVVVGPLPTVEPGPDASAWASVVERGEDHLVVRYRAASINLLRVAIPSFPGWHAALNGAELDVHTADHAFLGVVVPAGEGEIRLWYAPRFFWLGAAISAAALMLVLVALRPGRAQ
jgi:hypothetical protein